MQHTGDGTGQGQIRLNLTATFNLSNQCCGHPCESQALTGRNQQIGIPVTPQGQKLCLSRGPFRHQNIRQGGIGFEHIPWSKGIDPLHKAGGTGLNHRDITLVERQDTCHI